MKRTRYTSIIVAILRDYGVKADPIRVEVEMEKTWSDLNQIKMLDFIPVVIETGKVCQGSEK